MTDQKEKQDVAVISNSIDRTAKISRIVANMQARREAYGEKPVPYAKPDQGKGCSVSRNGIRVWRADDAHKGVIVTGKRH